MAGAFMSNMRMKIKSTARRAAFAMTAWSCAACAAFAADVKGNASDSAFAPAVTENSTLVLGVSHGGWIPVAPVILEIPSMSSGESRKIRLFQG